LVIDPGYAAAWVELGRCRIYEAGGGYGEAGGLRAPEEASRLAREATIKALAIDPDNVEVYDNLAAIAMRFDADLAAAARYYEHALALEPGNPRVLGNAADLAMVLGRLNLAIALGEHWVAHDPLNPGSHAALGNVYAAAGRFDDAIVCWRSMEAQLAPYPAEGLQAAIGMALLLKGDLDGALSAVQRERSEIPRVTTLPMIYHALGRHAESDAALATLIAGYGDQIPTVVAGQLAFRGDADRAFAWLDKAMKAHDPGLPGIAGNRLFANLHGDARWLPLLLNLGRAPEQLSEIEFEVTLPPQGG
jgi:tetratricopeptide (TPR) repeat protein